MDLPILHLLKIEWLKVRKYRTFRVLLGLFVICVPAVNFMVYAVQLQVPAELRRQMDTMQYFRFPAVWQTAAYFGSYVLILLGLLLITLTTNEFVFKTCRQNVIDGLSRTQFILSKWIMIAVFSFVAVVCLVITVFLLGLLTTDMPLTGNIAENSRYIWIFFVQSLLYLSVAFLFAMLFRRAGLAITLFILYALIIERIFSFIISRFAANAGTFLPLSAADHLVPGPLHGLAGNIMRSAPGEPPSYVYLIAALAYIAVIYLFTARHIRKADLA